MIAWFHSKLLIFEDDIKIRKIFMVDFSRFFGQNRVLREKLSVLKKKLTSIRHSFHELSLVTFMLKNGENGQFR